MDSLSIPSEWINSPINIVVVGAGGTGSALITELFQMNYLLTQLSDGNQFFNVTVYDSDLVSTTNVGRQNFWAHDIGTNKAKAIIERFNTFGGINWNYRSKDFKVDQLTSSVDLLITCVDKASVRAEIGLYETSLATLWLDTGNDSNSGQVVLGHIAKGKTLLPNVYDLYPELGNVVDVDIDSCSHAAALAKQDYGINKRVALEATNLIWQLIRHGSICNHGSFVDIKSGTTTPLKISAEQWLMHGFDVNSLKE